MPGLFEVESFATVHHLVSTVSGRLRRDCDAIDLLRACFPGGAITGAPKRRAMQIIDELEPERREVYCGNVLFLTDGAELQFKPEGAVENKKCKNVGGYVICF